jgi:hypothetical protein
MATVGFLFTACGGDAASVGATATDAITTTTTSTITPALTSTVTTAATTTPVSPPEGPAAPGDGLLTVTGTVTEGVEAGCRVLDGYLLIGGPSDLLQPGARITVIGRIDPDVLSYCQQGTPLLVESVRPG